jgi:hypothetical protein
MTTVTNNFDGKNLLGVDRICHKVVPNQPPMLSQESGRGRGRCIFFGLFSLECSWNQIIRKRKYFFPSFFPICISASEQKSMNCLKQSKHVKE